MCNMAYRMKPSVFLCGVNVSALAYSTKSIVSQRSYEAITSSAKSACAQEKEGGLYQSIIFLPQFMGKLQIKTSRTYKSIRYLQG